MHGFSILSALFLLVVLSALGAVLVTVSTTQHTSSALDVEGVRAYQAARAGLEWGLYATRKKSLEDRSQEEGSQTVIPKTCPFSTDQSFQPGASGLAQFTVTVTCKAYVHEKVTVFMIKATACNQPRGQSCPGVGQSTYYVERQLQASVEG